MSDFVNIREIKSFERSSAFVSPRILSRDRRIKQKGYQRNGYTVRDIPGPINFQPYAMYFHPLVVQLFIKIYVINFTSSIVISKSRNLKYIYIYFD